MFDKDKVAYHGTGIAHSHGPYCETNKCMVGSSACVDCKYCYGRHMLVWSEYDGITGEIWHNSGYSGYVLCAEHNNKFIAKIKNHIFRLKGKNGTVINVKRSNTND